MTNTIVCVMGTRPEAIKMAPVVRAMKAAPWVRCVVAATAQHRDLLDQMLARLRIAVDHDLDLMMDGQTSSGLLARMLPALDEVLTHEQPDIVLAQGDTTSVFGAALCAFHRRIAFGHVEAGLRTSNLEHPFPEEGYRQMIARVARWHFAPTIGAARALLAEGIAEDRIHVTGNTGIDALFQALGEMGAAPAASGRSILLTVHRRESFGAPLRDIFAAILKIVEQFPDVCVTYPVHPNPNVRDPANEMLAGHPRIRLCDPLDYFEFIDRMRRSTLILTDSGGIQEEAPALGKPVLVLRDTTERPEALACGSSRLAGTNAKRIVEEVSTLLETPDLLTEMSQVRYPYGDGKAGQRILDILHGDIVAKRAGAVLPATH
ncbi:MAG: UDP-N-acetylglucosamine 2-epimerase (non-hydrolyzing) [Zoogloeaceae bacterium]|jgi:UDP-N-acetylglucosamine 2-epimerase (non-hydrolysing)|nr:UDP-N-acetylglucosamine 2-epimerase (non-hydrolyzing) [Zoogloeaceae bacterium]